jgi:hypothetical protein
MRRVVVLLVILTLTLQPVGVGVVSGATDTTIQRTTTLSLTPDEPGAFDAEVAFDVPSNVGSLTTSVPEDATVTDTVGFEPDGTNEYTWDGDGQDPQLTMTVPANQTGVGLRDHTTNSGYKFVDAGPWAIVSTPAMSTSWSYRGDKPSFESVVTTDGPGVAGERMVYLGPSTTYQRSAHGQTFTVVVPDAATLEEDTEAILDSLEAASLSLRIGERDPEVTFFVAPSSVEWAAGGLASDADAWILEDRRLDEANNVWLHEYVHTRTDFRTTDDARWLTEASAEYYAALLSLEQGLIGFEAFQRHLSLGASDRYESSVMTRPATWTAGANYLKGALVFGNLDRELRVTTDSTHTTGDLLARMNDRDTDISHAFVSQTIDDLGGSTTAEYLERYATTEDTPDVWTRDEHADAFSQLPPQMVVEPDPTYRVRGPYRNQTTSQPPLLVPGESLTVNATVTNQGDVAGNYNISMLVDEEPVDSATGDLGPQESTSVAFTTIVEETGTARITIGEVSTTVSVESPASLLVSDLSVDSSTVIPGEAVSVSVTATNPAEKPAAGELTVQTDGTNVSSWQQRLGVGETETRTVSVVLEEPGTHTISVGDRSVEVTVEQGRAGGDTTPASTPGFGPVAAGGAIAMVVVALAWRRDP